MPLLLLRGARTAPAAVVLQPAADEVRLPHVGADRVELSDRHACSRIPTSPLVVGDVEAAVVANHHVIGVRADRSRSRDGRCEECPAPFPRLAAVNRLEERRATLIRNLGVGGIDPHLAVIHPAVPLVRQEAPRLAAVVRSPDPTLGGSGGGVAWPRPPPPPPPTALPRRHQCSIVIDPGAGSAARSDLDRCVNR